VSEGIFEENLYVYIVILFHIEELSAKPTPAFVLLVCVMVYFDSSM